MVGDDACTTFVELLKKLLDIVGSMEENRKRGVGKQYASNPKIKYGKLSKQNFKKLQKAGMEFKFVTVPADKLPEIEENVMKMGGSYFKAEMGDSNNAVLAVPSSQIDLLQTSMKAVVGNDLKSDPDRVVVKDGTNDLISGEDMGIVRHTLDKYDIPVISFKTADDKYMNIVPKEFEGQYSKAMEEAKNVKKEVEGIDITRYDQTAPLDDLDYEAFEVSEDEAKDLYAASKSDKLDVTFVPYGDNVAVMYKSDIAEKVSKAREEYEQSLKASEDFIIDVYDNIITLDMKKLNVEDLNTEKSFFMRVPNTSGQDYIYIDKSEAEMINGEKTLKTELDFEKTYPVYNAEGKVMRPVSGSELVGYFNTRNRRINKETEIYKYGFGIDEDGGELRRIDLYNSKKNELISVKMGSAEEMKIALRERGLNSDTIGKLLNDINKELNDKQREIFSYTAEKTEIAYADIPNIGEYLAQSQLSQTVIGKAECMRELPRDIGAKCCVFDTNANKFAVLSVAPVNEIRSMLTQMGYSEISAKEIADKIVCSYRDTDTFAKTGEKEHHSQADRTAEPQRYETTNAELSDMGFFNVGESTIIIKDDAENYQYMQLEKDTPLAEVEKSLRNDFGLLDSMSVAVVTKQLIDDNFITDARTQESKEATVRQLSSDMIEVTGKETGKSEVMSMEKIDTDSLVSLGISEKGASDIKKSFDKSISESKSPDRQTLAELKQHAKEKFKEMSQAAKEKVSSIGKGQVR